MPVENSYRPKRQKKLISWKSQNLRQELLLWTCEVSEDRMDRKLLKKRPWDNMMSRLELLKSIWGTTLEINSDQCFSPCNTLFSPCYTLFGSKVESIKYLFRQSIHFRKSASHPSLKFLLGMVGRRASQSHWCLRRLPRPSITSHQLCSYVSDTCALAVRLSCPLPHLLHTHQWLGGN